MNNNNNNSGTNNSQNIPKNFLYALYVFSKKKKFYALRKENDINLVIKYSH